MNWKFWKKPKPILCACDPCNANKTLDQSLKGILDSIDQSIYPGTSPSPSAGDYRVIEIIETDENGSLSTKYQLDRYSYFGSWDKIGMYGSMELAIEGRKKHNVTYIRKVVDYHTNK